MYHLGMDVSVDSIESFWEVSRLQHVRSKPKRKRSVPKEMCKTCNIPLVNGHCKNESGIPDIAWAHRVGRSNVGAHVDDHLIPEEFRVPRGANRQ